MRARASKWVIFAAIFAPWSAQAGRPDALDLMKKSDAQHTVSKERTVGAMLLQKQGSDTRKRGLETITVQDDRGGDKMLIRFQSPADIKGTAFLSIQDPKTKNTEQWLYLPSFRKTRRVGEAELGDRFVGSDIYFEDLQAREVEDYSYTHLKVESVDGHDCWVIESKPSAPKAKKESPYGKSHLWLRKDNLFVVRVRHSDRRMRPIKEITMEKVHQVEGNAWRADKVTVVDIKRKHRTVMLVSNRDTGVTLSKETFSQHRLGSD